MPTVILIHGMFQNPKSWDRWLAAFSGRGYDVVAPAWPFHEGDPRELRDNPPVGLGKLTFRQVIDSLEAEVRRHEKPIVIGHSVGGLITQILLQEGLIAAGAAISSVAPNRMLDFDWGFLKNSALIANPLMGDSPIRMDATTFHGAFANSLNAEEAERAFEATATHDSRNVLRGCMGPDGQLNLDAPHAPLLLIGGEKDEIIPAHLNEKNFKAYSDAGSVTEFRVFPGRSHFICNEPGWEEVADSVIAFLERNRAALPA